MRKRAARAEAGHPRWQTLAARVAVAFAFAAGFYGLAALFRSEDDLGEPPEQIEDPVVLELLELSHRAIRREYNYTRALGHLQKALARLPGNFALKHFYGSVLLSLDRVEEACTEFRLIFNSRSRINRDPSFLQQYVLALHRLGREEELRRAWPKVVEVPEVKWASPLQCPDRVDETLLEGATPFPNASAFKVTALMQSQSTKIIEEFNLFRMQQPQWSSTSFFRANQERRGRL